MILAIAAFAALGAVALWLYLDSSTSPRPAAAIVQPTMSPTAAVIAPVHMTSVAEAAVPVPTAPPMSEGNSAPKPTQRPADPPQPVHATTTDTSPVAPAEAEVSSSGSETESPPTEPAAAPDPAQAPGASIEEGGGHDEALDLFAERIATLEQGDDPNNATDVRLLNEFKARAEDEASSSQRAQVLHDHVSAWLAGFPAERADRLTLVSVECRSGACQLLIAEKKPEVSGRSNDTFESSFQLLVNEDWCTQLRLSLQSIAMHAVRSGADDEPDYALWTTYLGDAT